MFSVSINLVHVDLNVVISIMSKTWRTMFFLGQPQHPTEMKYLLAETTIYGDIVQGSQTDSYYNLTLKTEMGLEWAVK